MRLAVMTFIGGAGKHPMQTERTLGDTSNYSLLITLGEAKEIVVGVPHHAPLGVPHLPCKEHPDSDENAGYIGYRVAQLLDCNSIIACNSPIDPNKDPESDYCRTILSWEPKVLVEIHGHASQKANFDIEISSGSQAKNLWSRLLAQKLGAKISAPSLLQDYTLSGDFNSIYFRATKSFTIATDKWLPFHIELPKSIRESEDQYSLFCVALAEAIAGILLSYRGPSESQSEDANEYRVQ